MGTEGQSKNNVKILFNRYVCLHCIYFELKAYLYVRTFSLLNWKIFCAVNWHHYRQLSTINSKFGLKPFILL